MYNKIRFDTFMLMCFFMITILGLSACDSDEKITQEPPSQTYVKKAKEILAGDIVLSTRATMNGVDKTLLKSGCPTKFNFSWREDGMMIPVSYTHLFCKLSSHSYHLMAQKKDMGATKL